jgi:hypothetical protein
MFCSKMAAMGNRYGTSQFLAAVWRTRHLFTTEETTLPHMKVPGSAHLRKTMSAIDNHAERETGN